MMMRTTSMETAAIPTVQKVDAAMVSSLEPKRVTMVTAIQTPNQMPAEPTAAQLHAETAFMTQANIATHWPWALTKKTAHRIIGV